VCANTGSSASLKPLYLLQTSSRSIPFLIFPETFRNEVTVNRQTRRERESKKKKKEKKMSLLQIQPSLQNQNVALSSSLCYSPPLRLNHSSSLTLGHTQKPCFQRLTVTCSISKIHSYGTVDYERRPIVRWNDVYRKISLMKNPEMGSASVLNQWENGGRNLTKWELSRVVKELRKYRRYERALEVRISS